jgi:hypothetical protein
MVCCTGNPTSTFGGGGGTKLFCSQALNATHTAMARDMRAIAAAPCLAVRCGLMHAGGRIGFISVTQFVFSGKGFMRKQAFGYPIKIATIHLRRNSKAKMMPPANFYAELFSISLQLKRLLQRQ